jgi:2-C-methyl-D-erythritol 4-phosphate cytidylyltransferase
VSVWTVVVAAGMGQRFGAPKQYELLGGHRVLDWSIDAARSVSDGIVLAVPADRLAEPEPSVDVVVAGGPTRSASVRAGLAAIPDEATVVIVHDAARPLARPSLFAAVVDALATADGAVPGVPVVDTIKRVRDGQVVATLERAELIAVQTPQAFRAPVLRMAHATGGTATDDAALVEAVAGRVVVVAGDTDNVKLTTAADLARAREVVAGLGAPS